MKLDKKIIKFVKELQEYDRKTLAKLFGEELVEKVIKVKEISQELANQYVKTKELLQVEIPNIDMEVIKKEVEILEEKMGQFLTVIEDEETLSVFVKNEKLFKQLYAIVMKIKVVKIDFKLIKEQLKEDMEEYFKEIEKVLDKKTKINLKAIGIVVGVIFLVGIISTVLFM